MSLTNWNRFSAIFLDSRDNLVGKKVFAHSGGGYGLSLKTFEYEGGTYNYNPLAFRLTLIHWSHFFYDDVIFVYYLGNPDPLMHVGSVLLPVIQADQYKQMKDSKLMVELNEAAKGGLDLKKILPYVLGGIVLIGVIYWASTGGLNSLFGHAPVVAQNVTTNLTNTTLPNHVQMINSSVASARVGGIYTVPG